MASKFQTSRATLRDVPNLSPLFDEYRVFYGCRSDPHLATRFLLDRLTRGESVILLARDGDNAPPSGFIQMYPSFSSVAAAKIWILNDLYVSPGARRQGVGKALLLATENHARATGAARIELTTGHDNADAQKLYASVGYLPESEFRTYTYSLGKPHSVGATPAP